MTGLLASLALWGCGEPELQEDTAVLVLCDPSMWTELVDAEGAALTDAEILAGSGGGWYVEMFLSIYNLDPSSELASVRLSGITEDGALVLLNEQTFPPQQTGDPCEPWRTPAITGNVNASGLDGFDACQDPRALLDDALIAVEGLVADGLGAEAGFSAEVRLWSDTEVCP